MIEFRVNNANQFWVEYNQAFSNFGIPIERAAKIIKTHFQKAEGVLFKTEGGSGKSGKWPALSRAYKAYKDRYYPGRTIMIREGTLEKSLTSDSPDFIFITSKIGRGYQIRLGTTSEVAEYHYKGIPSGTGIKVRKTIDPPIMLLNEFARIILNEILKDMKIHKTLFEVATENRQPTFSRG